MEIKKVETSTVLPLRHQVLWPDMPFEYVKVAEDDSAVHLAIMQGENAICVISLFEDESGLRFRKFATDPSFQNRGYGSQMMQYVIQYATEQGYPRIWCDARADALRFYEKFDFQKFSEVFHKGDIPYFKIEKKLV